MKKYILIFMFLSLFCVRAEGQELTLPQKHLIYGVPYESQPAGSSYCGEG